MRFSAYHLCIKEGDGMATSGRDGGALVEESPICEREVRVATNGQGGFNERDLEIASRVFTIVGVIGGLLSIILVLIQIRRGNEITKAQNAQKLVELTMISNMELAKNPELEHIWETGNKNYDSLDEKDKPRFRRVWIIYLNILENAFSQWRKGMMDGEEFESWDRDLKKNRKTLSRIWPDLSGHYNARFQQHVAQAINAQEAAVKAKAATPGL
jgi:hypothetical protein